MSKFMGLTSIHTSHKHIRFNWFKHSRLWVSGAAPKRTQTERRSVFYCGFQMTSRPNKPQHLLMAEGLLSHRYVPLASMDFPPNVWTWPTGSPLFRSLSCLSWDVMCVCNYWSWAAGRHRAGRGRDDIVSQRPLLHGSTTRHTESTQTSRTVKRLPDGYLNGSPSVEREEGRKELILICPLINMIHAFPWQALWKVYSWKRSIGLYLHIFPLKPNTAITLCHSALGLWPKRYHSCSLSMTYC